MRQWREQIKEYIEEDPELEYSRSDFVTAVEEKLVLYEALQSEGGHFID